MNLVNERVHAEMFIKMDSYTSAILRINFCTNIFNTLKLKVVLFSVVI
jgi:hypothetical protein